MTLEGQDLAKDILKAVDEGNVAEVKGLLQQPGIVVNGTNKHGESPLHIATGYGYMHITRMLLDNGAHIDLKDKHGDTPLYWAARHGHADMVQFLLTKGAVLDTQDKSGETALHVSCRYGYSDVVSCLCQAQASLDVQDKDGETALHCATWHGFQTIVECLVRAGCSLLLQNNDYETPLHIAAVRGYYNIVRFLCQSNADINKQDKNGCPPVHLATRRNHLDIVQYLCELKCDVDIKDKLGETPVHDACRDGNLSLVQTLYAAGCDLDIANKKNKATPLHLAAKYGHTEIVRCLCAAGCDLTMTTEQGHFADEVAAGAGHSTTAEVLHNLRMNAQRDHYITELAPATTSISKVKLLVCGGAGVGKTELISSLKCSRFKSLFRRRSASDLAHMVANRTYGFNVTQTTIPNAGDFSIWDFSGRKDYYIGHESFLQERNAIFLIVFSLKDPVDRQLMQVQHWLAMIKAKQSTAKYVSYRRHSTTKPFVVLVGSFADQQPPLLESVPSESGNGQAFAVPSAASVLNAKMDNGKSVFGKVVSQYSPYFVFPDIVYTLDCRLSQTQESKALRSLLGHLRQELIKKHTYVPRLTKTISDVLELWRMEHQNLPVLTWEGYHEKVRSHVNPLVSHDQLRPITLNLHEMGEVFSVEEGPLKNVVILDPGWLGTRILGPALSPENSVIPQLKSVTGRVSLQEIKRVFPQWNALSIVNLFQHFELCYPKERDEDIYVFPCLVKMQSVFGLWEKDPAMIVYAGIRLVTANEVDILTPSVFPLIQCRLRKIFKDDFDDQELTIWSDGLKCCRGEVEILVSLEEQESAVVIKVRGSKDSQRECYSLLHQFYSVVQLALSDAIPGADVITEILSSKYLSEHKPNFSYSPQFIFKAERSNGLVIHPDNPSLKEHIVDLLCCGCQELLLAAKSVPYMSSSTLPQKTRYKLCQLLDPPHPLGMDWCILALTLGLIDELPTIDKSTEGGSPTQRILSCWENSSQSSLAKLLDSLNHIGRHDAVQVLLEGISLFPSSNNTVVLNLPGIEATAYVC